MRNDYFAFYREKNRALLRAKARKRYWDNREAELSRKAQYYQENKITCALRSERWKSDNPERVKAMARDYYNRTKSGNV